MNNYKEIAQNTQQIVELCNELEKQILIKSVSDKSLMPIKDDIEKIRKLILKVLQGISTSSLVDFELVILYENDIYLGIVKHKYVIYSKREGKINILAKSKTLKKAIIKFYNYAYKKSL